MKDWTDWAVLDSRPKLPKTTDAINHIWRRRQNQTGDRITTVEITHVSYKRLLDISEKYRNLRNIIKLIVKEGVNE